MATSKDKALKKKRNPNQWFKVTDEAKLHHELDNSLKFGRNTKK